MNRTQRQLAHECRVLTRYLIGAWPRREIVERYIGSMGGTHPGNAALRSGESAALSRAGEGQRASRGWLTGGTPVPLIELSLRHPWLIGPLEAGCGFIDRDNPLRKKLLVLTAILEANPWYTEHFLPRDRPLPILLLILLANTLRATLKTLLGIPLVFLLNRPR